MRSIAAAAVVALLGLSACSSSTKKPAAARATSTTAVPATFAPSTSAPTGPAPTSPGSAPTQPAATPAGGPVPAGFQPISFSAVSDTEWWLLGDAVCAHKPCTSIVRTTDGGAHFVGIPAPTTALYGGVSDATNPNSVSEVAFADPMDGFAYRTQLWATHDGGAHWHQVPMAGQVTALAAADGYAYAVVAGNLYRSPVATDSWVGLAATNLSSQTLAVHGGDVVTQTAYSSATPSRLLVSHDNGAHFANFVSPDVGLGCMFDEPATAVIWAECTTGMESAVTRSTNGGATFPPLQHTQQFVNSASLAAASSTIAVVASLRNGGIGLYLTTDGGATFQPTGPALDTSASGWNFIGFTDALHGTAIATSSTGSGTGLTNTSTLYRTSDGGHTWSAVAVRP